MIIIKTRQSWWKTVTSGNVSQLIKIIHRNPRHRRPIFCISIRWVLVSWVRGGELPAWQLSKRHGHWPDSKPSRRSTGRLLRWQLWDLQRRVGALGQHHLYQKLPQQCSERKQASADWRIDVKKHRVDLVGRFSFPAGTFWCQAWRDALHRSTVWRSGRGKW